MGWPDFNECKLFIVQFDQAAAIDKDKDKDLRYDVWKTTKKVNEVITRKEIEGWQVCAIGECYADVLMILKREKS